MDRAWEPFVTYAQRGQVRVSSDLPGPAVLARLERAVADGEVPADADLDTIASYYLTVLQGLSIQARGGASRQIVNATVDYAVLAWDELAVRPKAGRSA